MRHELIDALAIQHEIEEREAKIKRLERMKRALIVERIEQLDIKRKAEATRQLRIRAEWEVELTAIKEMIDSL